MKKQFCPHEHDVFVTGRYKNGDCKECHKITTKKLYQKNKKEIMEKQKKYNSNRKEFIKDYQKLYRFEHKQDLDIRHKMRVNNNREKVQKYKKQWRENNKVLININQKERLDTDVNFKLSSYLRHRLNSAIKNNYKSGSAVRDLGCSIEFLKKYVESKFYANMTWNNWGTVWELDHIKPLCKFDLTDRKQFLKACNYSNLQPLTIKDHRKKTNNDLL